MWRQRQKARRRKRPLAPGIDGAAPMFCSADKSMRRIFLSVVCDCTAVIACRVPPAQKADIVAANQEQHEAPRR